MSRVLIVLAGALVGLGVGSGGASAASGLPPFAQLNGDISGGVLSPSAAVNASGQAVVGWSEYLVGGNGPTALVNVRSASGAWSGPVQVSTPGQYAGNTHVTINAAGEATIAWSEGADADHATVHVERHTDAGFTGQQAFPVEHGDVLGLALATNDAGGGVVTWAAYGPCDGCVFSNYTGAVYAAVRGADGTYAAQQLSDAPPYNTTVPAAAINARGDLSVAWADGAADSERVHLRQLTAGGTFAPSLYLSPDGTRSQVPNLVVGPDGTVTAVWWQSKSMVATRVSADGTVGPVQALPGTLVTTFPFGRPTIAVDGAGRVTAAWMANDGLWVVTADPGATFGAGTMLDANVHEAPSLAADPAGGVVLAWADLSTFRAAWRPAGAAGFAPSAAIPDAPAAGTEIHAPVAALAGNTALLI
ncbi:MAG: hypothetical protein AAGC46_12620, partial [Solirubrobacteraceae bacterium]|nr:hypothetical protein [Patulibacter sp.]